MSNALHDYARLFEKYAANNGGTGAILAGEDCLSLANEMRMDADAIDAENAKLQETLQRRTKQFENMVGMWVERGVENAKLRELVRDLYEMAYPECPSAFEAAFADRMRELGVEVDS